MVCIFFTYKEDFVLFAYREGGHNATYIVFLQRAMLGGSDIGEESTEQLMQLPLDKKGGEMTEEDLLKKVEKNQKRRLAAQKRKEKRKVR